MEIPSKPDPAALVHKNGNDYVCNKCLKVLIRIEPNGILGQELNEIDLLMILDHNLTHHDPMRPVTLNPRFVWGP